MLYTFLHFCEADMARTFYGIAFLLNTFFFVTLCMDHSHDVKWKNYMKHWLSYQLKQNILKEPAVGFTAMLHKLLHTNNLIHKICFERRNVAKCGGDIFGLCNGVHLKVDQLYNCTWKMRVPSNSCIDITIIELPPSDPFDNNDYNLAIRYQNEYNYSQYNVNIQRKFEPFSLISNSSIVSVNLKINYLFEPTKTHLTFQTTQCGRIISYHYRKVLHAHGALKLPNTMPFANHVKSAVTEYHILVQTKFEKNVHVHLSCILAKRYFDVYDGPSPKAPALKQNKRCRKALNKVVTIKASTFQMYLVYHHMNTSRNFHLSYSIHESNNDFETVFLRGDGEIWFEWDFRNKSRVYSKTLMINSPRNRPFKYRIAIGLSKEGAQGFSCQYGGVVIAPEKMMSQRSHIHIGPICNVEHSRLLKNNTFFTHIGHLMVIIYQYSISSAQHGMIIFDNDSPEHCVGLLNPCVICQDRVVPFLMRIELPVFKIGINCNMKFAAFNLKAGCVVFTVMMNSQFGNDVDECTWLTYSDTMSSFDTDMVLKRSDCQGPECGMTVPLLSDAAIEKYDKFTSRQLSYTFSTTLISTLFKRSNKGLFWVKATYNPSRKCQTIILPPPKAVVPEHTALCLVSSVSLQTDQTFSFKVSITNAGKVLNQCHNQFIVAALIKGESFDNKNVSDNDFTIMLGDGTFNVSDVKTYIFKSGHMPFIWRSYGNTLTVTIQTNRTGYEESQLWLQISADLKNERYAGLSCFSTDKYDLPLTKVVCEQDKTVYSPSQCYSVHTQSASDWMSAQSKCHDQGGYLWSVNNLHEWENIMMTRQWRNAYGYTVESPDVMLYLRNSSLMFLGLQMNSKVQYFAPIPRKA